MIFVLQTECTSTSQHNVCPQECCRYGSNEKEGIRCRQTTIHSEYNTISRNAFYPHLTILLFKGPSLKASHEMQASSIRKCKQMQSETFTAFNFYRCACSYDAFEIFRVKAQLNIQNIWKIILQLILFQKLVTVPRLLHLGHCTWLLYLGHSTWSL